MQKFFVILIAIILAGISGFLVSSVVAPYADPGSSRSTVRTDEQASMASSLSGSDATALMDAAAALASSDVTTLETASSSSSLSTVTSSASNSQGVYARYVDGVAGPAVIFLRRTADASTAMEAQLKALYASNSPPPLSTYRLDEQANPDAWKRLAAAIEVLPGGSGAFFALIDAQGLVIDVRGAMSPNALANFLFQR